MLFLAWASQRALPGCASTPGHTETENTMRKILVGVTGTVAAIVLMVAPATSASALGGVHSSSTPSAARTACGGCNVGF